MYRADVFECVGHLETDSVVDDRPLLQRNTNSALFGPELDPTAGGVEHEEPR